VDRLERRHQAPVSKHGLDARSYFLSRMAAGCAGMRCSACSDEARLFPGIIQSGSAGHFDRNPAAVPVTSRDYQTGVPRFPMTVPRGCQVVGVDNQAVGTADQLGRFVAEQLTARRAGEGETAVGSYCPQPFPGYIQDRVHELRLIGRLRPFILLLPQKTPSSMQGHRTQQYCPNSGDSCLRVQALPDLMAEYQRLGGQREQGVTAEDNEQP
jgi:hypothetical protein